MPNALSSAQIAGYERDGVIFPARVLSRAEVRACRANFVEATAGLAGPAQPIRQPHLRLRWAYDLALHPAVLDVVEDLLGPDLLVHSTIIFHKPPGDPAFVSWHQDGLYATLRVPNLTSAWIALADSTVENGCMRVVPGTHRAGILPHVEKPSGHNLLNHGQSVEGVDESLAVNVVLRAGEMSLHHAEIVHGSNPNQSRRSRIGFIIRFVTPGVLSVDHPLVRARGAAGCAHLPLLETPPAG
jgi:non-heme Fe2+,alpha-ketoglutarate-dependent halogenase